jgi:hypothetical protein
LIVAFTESQLQTMLTEAETAYHQLMMGGSVRVVVDQSGERVEYTAANSARLMSYITYLKNQLGLLGHNGPAGVFF